MKLENPKRINKKEAIKIFENGKTDEICDALLSVTYYEEDWMWCQEQCLLFLDHINPNVRGIAATCLGHIARIHHKLNKNLVIDSLRKHLNDSSIAGQIQDALDDIENFIKD